MTENSASLGVPPESRPAPKRIYKSRPGLNDIQSCQSLVRGTVSAATGLSSGECRLYLDLRNASSSTGRGSFGWIRGLFGTFANPLSSMFGVKATRQGTQP
jgi:hypothetical protein